MRLKLLTNLNTLLLVAVFQALAGAAQAQGVAAGEVIVDIARGLVLSDHAGAVEHHFGVAAEAAEEKHPRLHD